MLAKLMFGLDDFEGSWAPSFRSLISYFVRREREGGMQQPMVQVGQQRLVDQQVNISFLVGLDWSVPREWQSVREREKSLEQLKKGMSDGVFGAIIGSASTLKSELIVAQDRARRLRAGVASFKVVDQYHDLEREASALTARLAENADENVLDRRYLAELETTTVEEVPPAPEDLDLLYKEAGVTLPDLVRRRFEDVGAFHKSVVKNRRAYLRGEIEAVKRRITEREAEKTKLDERRSEVMTVLKSAGALDQFTALQGELAKAEAHAHALAQKHESAEAMETGDLKLKVARAHLVERLRQDYTEQEQVITDAVLAFSEIASELYEGTQAGNLTIAPTDNGPVFEPHIPGEKSRGVNNMRIFCFDMMLTLLSVHRGRSPGFLVHDSHLFDGVDERQVGKALAVGASLAKRHGFQYIVTMNTDDVPREVPSGFKIDDYALDQRLTDASEDGGLFGLRFD
ncbi:MAG TPA: ABC-three component system protein [Polyangiaceae bacterium]